MEKQRSARILVIEDERAMQTVLQDCLQGQGYRVILAIDGEQGLEKALCENPDLVLLDIMMPKLDGFSLCSELRRLEQKMPILILTAKSSTEERIYGLDIGADDYLVKPFSRGELLARVRASLRRLERDSSSPTEIRLGRIKIDFARKRAWCGKKPLSLTAKELAIMRFLAEHAGETISRERFLDVVWGYTAFPTTRTVDRHVATLRDKLEENPEEPRWIRTVHGQGYRLELD